MSDNSRVRTLAVRTALTLACVAAFAVSWPTVRTADAQTVRVCSNTGCNGIDRCYFFGGINCSMTYNSCTNRGCA
jgi:hypothetical protein